MSSLEWKIVFVCVCLHYLTHSYSGHRRRCFPPVLQSLWTWPAFPSNGTRPEQPTPCYYCDTARGTPETDPRKAPRCWSDGRRPGTSPAHREMKTWAWSRETGVELLLSNCPVCCFPVSLYSRKTIRIKYTMVTCFIFIYNTNFNRHSSGLVIAAIVRERTSSSSQRCG